MFVHNWQLYLLAVVQRLHDYCHHQVHENKLDRDDKGGEENGRSPGQVGMTPPLVIDIAVWHCVLQGRDGDFILYFLES